MPYSLAQCMLDEPRAASEVEGDPLYLQICGLVLEPGGEIIPCPAPLPPTLYSGYDKHAQELVLTAVSSIDWARAVWWEAQELDPEPGVASRQLWVRRSVQDVPANGFPAGEQVFFGAPGLTRNLDHRFRVALEYDGGGKTCWSSWTTISLNEEFEHFGPKPPQSTALRVQDLFDRPDTDPELDNPANGTPGDGLGPDEVWDDNTSVSDEHRPQIELGSAKMQPSSTITYSRRGATHTHSYAEMMARVDLSGTVSSKGNLQVTARRWWQEDDLYPEGGVIKDYSVKFIWGPQHCHQPTLFLVRLPDEYVKASCVETGPDTSVPIDSDFGVLCTQEPPLMVEDTSPGVPPDRSEAVWLRIETEDVGTEVELKGIIAWDCPEVDPNDPLLPIEDCAHSCTFSRTDESEKRLSNVLGLWGMGFHENRYFVDLFRAGNQE